MNTFDFYIKTKKDLTDAVNKYGFVPLFANSIQGFSIEENVDPKAWYSAGDGSWKVWEWKGPVIKETGCAYGKFFEHKAVFISREWFPDFANYRREGYDFDALYDDGKARFTDKELFELIDENAPITSKHLKRLGNYGKNGKKGFDSIITRLQEQGYITPTDFVYQKDKYGVEYGWGVAEYSTPEKAFGTDFTDRVYLREPNESYERIFRHLRTILPYADEKQIKKLLK
jgi:hypothetical protein